MGNTSNIFPFFNKFIEEKGGWIVHVFCAVIGIRLFFEVSGITNQVLALGFLLTFLFASVLRKNRVLFYPIFITSLFLFTFITIFAKLDFFTLHSFTYLILIACAFILPNPLGNLLVGSALASLLFTYQDRMPLPYIQDCLVGIAMNTVFYSLLAHFVRYFLSRKKELQESERNNLLLLKLLPDPLIIHQDGEIKYINQEGLRVLGAKNSDEIIGKSIFHLVEPSYHQMVTNRINETFQTKMIRTPLLLKITKLNNELIDIETIGTAIKYNDQPAVLTIVRDITAIKNQTDELIQKSDKLALVGQLAAGIAHEIRNPLTSLRGFIQLLHYKSEENKEYCDIMLAELDRINLIVGEFLILAKPHMVQYYQKDINDIIRHVVTLIGTQAILKNVDLQCKFTKNLPKIPCEENQLKQVFINLIKNALEAMDQGGTITVQTGQYDADHIFIKISDEGKGMPKEMLSKLGEPFYTTKEQGTGLGLMVCYKIIENHSGQLKVESEIGYGTTFEIILPITMPNTEYPTIRKSS